MTNRRFSLRAGVLFSTILLMSLVLVSVASAHDSNERIYKVSIINLTDGQPFTPPVIVTHSKKATIFERRQPATFEVKEIAENGNLDPMVAFLEGSDAISDFEVAVAGDPPPLMPRSLLSAEISAYSDHDVFSMVSMLICTNDGFGGVNSRTLPKNVGSSKVYKIRAYDAGTETNTEDFADIVPPCPALTGVDSMDDGTGMSNPELAENGVIRRHRGVHGFDDLVADIHDWSGAVGLVYIERVH